MALTLDVFLDLVDRVLPAMAKKKASAGKVDVFAAAKAALIAELRAEEADVTGELFPSL